MATTSLFALILATAVLQVIGSLIYAIVDRRVAAIYFTVSTIVIAAGAWYFSSVYSWEATAHFAAKGLILSLVFSATGSAFRSWQESAI